METEGKRPFDIALGKALQGERVKRGWRAAKDFAPYVEEVTGIKLSEHQLRRIECGMQSCTVEQYAAICFALCEDFPRTDTLDAGVKIFQKHQAGAAIAREFEGFAEEVEGDPDYYPEAVREVVRAFRAGRLDSPELQYKYFRLADYLGLANFLRKEHIRGGSSPRLDGLVEELDGAANAEELARIMYSRFRWYPETLEEYQAETAGHGETIEEA